jgi:hypothetical protein
MLQGVYQFTMASRGWMLVNGTWHQLAGLKCMIYAATEQVRLERTEVTFRQWFRLTNEPTIFFPRIDTTAHRPYNF